MTEPTDRQLAILVAYVECGGSKPAADRLGVSERTVRDVLSVLHVVIGGTNSAQTFAIAVQRGLIDPHKLRLVEVA
jgi:DNA-binding NarL/FixJ family response regulator